ncbi:hypothetical protein OH491_20640 [Termitidicoccus mucosus]|uniref:Uncharacterized protein n=1 Tax=Termitidicoccus mucosus TaxID=1184151 RepID=A0A178ICI6_9BACT|nr:hypothetical protein AW736_23065 [Opitutaceae bacterium TSB47]
MPFFRKRTKRILIILAALAVFLLGGYAGARWVAWPWFKGWRETRTNHIAREYLEKGDYPNALVAARKTLKYNQNNIDAWKLAAEITEKQEASDTLYYHQRLSIVQPTLENKLKLLRLALEFRAYNYVASTIDHPGVDVSRSAEFYKLAAQISLRAGNPAKARYLLMSLVSLQPSDESRLELAQLNLMNGLDENKAGARGEIREIAARSPALQGRALAVLLADAMENADAATSLELAAQLDTQAELSPSTRLLIADTHRLFAPDRFPATVQSLENSFASSPGSTVALATYLAKNGHAAEAVRWLSTLPAETRAIETIQIAHASALLALNDWPALDSYLRATRWAQNEYARQILLARAARERGDQRAFADAWRLAVMDIGNTPRKINALYSQVSRWGWTDQKNELLWKRFQLNPADKTTRDQLAAWELSRGNTSGLNRLYARLLEQNPSDADAKNNLAYTNILLGTNVERSAADAQALHESDPFNAYYLTTLALAHYRQGKPVEALNTIDKLGLGVLTSPQRTLLRSVILIANNRVDEGADLLARVQTDRLLPEERRLLTEAAPAIAKARRGQRNLAHLASLTTADAASGTSAAVKSWLALLSENQRPEPTSQMELAESFYALDDYAALENTLNSGAWPRPYEHLRNALLAYSRRQLGQSSDARVSWRVALGSAGMNRDSLLDLAALCADWGWTPERIEILNRIHQRTPLDNANFTELAAYYHQNGQTAELARIYAVRIDAGDEDPANKSLLAYYSLLTDSNLARAHVLARQTHDRAPADPLHAKVYAYSLCKQSRPAEAARILADLPDQPETGYAQLALIKAATALLQNDTADARRYLENFDPSTALPEEVALADTIRQTLAQKDV